MSVTVREADLEVDRQAIIDIVFRLLNPLSGQSRFDWLYRYNPHGPGRAWLAIETGTGTLVGMLGAFARQVCIRERNEQAWVLGDFCIDDQYRSLGPALMLQRACFEEVDSGAAVFCYDFPSAAMMAVYKRLHINPSGYVVRFAKPLRVDRKIRGVINNPVLSGAISGAGNLLLRLRERNGRHDCSLEVTVQEGNCRDEFSELAKTIGDHYGVCAQRSAEYLNWRYVQNPLHKYELFTARRNGALLGYGVFLHEGEDAMLVDLFGLEEEAVLSALIVHGVALMMKRGVQTVSAALAEAHPYRALLERHGFKVREVSPMVIYSPSGSPAGEQGSDEKFLFMHGDRDS